MAIDPWDEMDDALIAIVSLIVRVREEGSDRYSVQATKQVVAAAHTLQSTIEEARRGHEHEPRQHD